MINKVIIEDEFPEYYIKIKAEAYYHGIVFAPDFYVTCKPIQLHILKSDICCQIDIKYINRNILYADVEYNWNMTRLYIEPDYVDLFIKFNSKSDMIKWKLSND